MLSMGKLSNKVSTKLSKTLEQYILYLGASWAMVCPVGVGASLAAVEGHLAPGWSCMMMTMIHLDDDDNNEDNADYHDDHNDGYYDPV